MGRATAVSAGLLITGSELSVDLSYTTTAVMVLPLPQSESILFFSVSIKQTTWLWQTKSSAYN